MFLGVIPIIMAKKLVVNQTQTSSAVSTSSEPGVLLQPDLHETPAAPTVARAHCVQCGKTLRTMPFFLGNITCRECYGSERYSRGPGVPIGALSLSAPQVDNSYTA